MELYVYETPDGNIADFRPYLDGYDHSFDDHRRLEEKDPRWEKVRNLRHPVDQGDLYGRIRFAGTSETVWRELMLFPIVWEGEYEPVDWEAPAGVGTSGRTGR